MVTYTIYKHVNMVTYAICKTRLYVGSDIGGDEGALGHVSSEGGLQTCYREVSGGRLFSLPVKGIDPTAVK